MQLNIIWSEILSNYLKLSISILEALLVGVSLNLDHLETLPPQKTKALYKKMEKHEEFSEEKLSEGLSGKARVLGRLNAAKEIFS